MEPSTVKAYPLLLMPLEIISAFLVEISLWIRVLFTLENSIFPSAIREPIISILSLIWPKVRSDWEYMEPPV
ncbi:hypothetical protein D3C81_1973130 [compost metagenome]